MHYHETGFVRAEEYKAGISNRKSEAELVDGEIYSVMYSLVDNERKHEAAIMPVSIIGKMALNGDQRELGLYRVNLAALDGDLNPQFEVEGTFMDGLWIDVKKKMNIVDVSEAQRLAIPTVEAYIKDYDDGMHEFRWIEASEQKTKELALTAGATK